MHGSSNPLNVLGSSHSPILGTILDLRGGAAKKKSRIGSLSSSSKTVTGKKKVGANKDSSDNKKPQFDMVEIYKSILPLTRVYMTMVVVCTVLGLLIGDERAQTILALDPMRVITGWEFWRIFTAASCMGQPSLNWIFNGYHIFEYGSKLERAYGPAQFLVFMLSQFAILSFLSALLGIPFFTTSVVTSMCHVLSRATPKEEVKWLLFKIPFFLLPWGVMVSDVLQSQSVSAAIPHIVGILSGHFYHFHRFIWPKVGGEDWLVAPDFLVEYIDSYLAPKNSARVAMNKALKSRTKGKGKKLGTA
jgi:derlin-1